MRPSREENFFVAARLLTVVAVNFHKLFFCREAAAIEWEWGEGIDGGEVGGCRVGASMEGLECRRLVSPRLD